MQQFQQAELERVLTEDTYSPRVALTLLAAIPEFGASLASKNSRKRDYTLFYHTLMACLLYERFFRHESMPGNFNRGSFRLMLCLHDIGKPRALEEDNKNLQHKYTLEMLASKRNCLPIDEIDYTVIRGLLSDDALGLYIRDKIPVIESADRIMRMNMIAGFNSVRTFLDLLTVYYQADAGAYTKAAFVPGAGEFVAKPKLEAIYCKDGNGDLVFSSTSHRLAFSPECEEKWQHLRANLT